MNEELQEHAEHAKEPFDRKVAVTMAVIAATLAFVSVAGHLATTEELLRQQQASDQWSFFQGKNGRRYVSEVARDILGGMSGETARASAEKYEKNSERYEKEGEAIQEKAKDFEKESKHAGRQARCLHVGEVFLEISIVFASLAILTKRKVVWLTAVLGSLIGAAIAIMAFFVDRIPFLFRLLSEP